MSPPTGEPAPPTGVRFVDREGEEHEASVAFAGYTPGGVARWYVLDPPPYEWHAIRVDTIPGRSELIFPAYRSERES